MFFRFVFYVVVVWLVSAKDEGCPEPPPVDNSILVVSEVEGCIVGTYFCTKDYHLVGEKTLVCNTSKEWSTPPECHVGHCAAPMLENGESSVSGPVSVDDIVVFRCRENHTLVGSTWSQCLLDHSWAPPFPICRSSLCDPPGSTVRGCYEGRDFDSKSAVSHCREERFPLVGTRAQGHVNSAWSELQTGAKKALLAFREHEDLCEAIGNFIQRLNETGLQIEHLKYFLEMKKVELEAKMLP